MPVGPRLPCSQLHNLAFQYGLSDMPTVADRAVDIAVKMFKLSEAWGWPSLGKEPLRVRARYKVEKHHERFRTPQGLYRPT